jgi:hypothetical protein
LGRQPINRSSLVDEHKQVLSQKLSTTFGEQECIRKTEMCCGKMPILVNQN